MKLGITGTRGGWTDQQREAFIALISDLDIGEFHHGDCVGVDEQSCSVIERTYGSPIHTHPPKDSSLRAFVGGKLYVPKDYIERNHNIVDLVDMLVVVPKERMEQKRSGTWATYRYAAKVGKPIAVLYPDGVVEQTA